MNEQVRRTRYLELARRCRVNAASASTDHGKAGLMRMADAYDRRGDELESRWLDQVGTDRGSTS